MNVFLTFLSPFYSVQDPAHEMMLSTFRVGLPIFIYLIKTIPHRHVWRLSWVILGIVELTVQTTTITRETLSTVWLKPTPGFGACDGWGSTWWKDCQSPLGLRLLPLPAPEGHGFRLLFTGGPLVFFSISRYMSTSSLNSRSSSSLSLFILFLSPPGWTEAAFSPSYLKEFCSLKYLTVKPCQCFKLLVTLLCCSFKDSHTSFKRMF